jgi:DNA polymerase III alpha subunit (gram-positive type)
VILAAIDFEATGLDLNNDRIAEVGYVLYSTGRERVIEQTSFLVNTDGKLLTEESTGITHITQDLVDAFGYPQNTAVETFNEYLEQADAVIGHNLLWYDLPMVRNAAKRLSLPLVEKLAIDTMTDIPGVKGQKLITMCADAKDPKTGRDVSFTYTKHSALDDAKAVLRLISWHDIEAIKARAESPTWVVLSHQGYGDAPNKLARQAGFRFKGAPYKIWWQAVKECDFAELKAKVSFDISITKDYTPEQLRD